MRIEILCPVHGDREIVELPDNYATDFDGHIPCADIQNPVMLRLVLKVEGRETAVSMLFVEPSSFSNQE